MILLASLPAFAQDAPPRSLDDRLEITLFAEDPLLNTPTGIDVDHKGRVWVIESNTHFPPEGYDGHPTDRLLILEDSNGDGKAEAKMFADGFTHSMSVAARPVWLDPISFSKEDKPDDLKQRTQIYLATRREILLLEDTDGDDKCDKQTRLVHLETEGNYPHNGLAGFAFDGLGNMYFGFGENLGADYKIIGRDGTTYSGGGEGGNIYQVQPDGTKLKHWATGFWNPHANCVDAFGRLFSVDNDPDSLPPCRLLHIIEGGDYGYRFRNGRKGLHPFTAWNGEIPGNLPMVAGTGEAPSGILAYEHSAFPEEYLGNLMVTSWGDHRIDRFQLIYKGASFESVAEPFIVGGENFRPVGIALAPDGSLYLSDWVLRDYKLHGKGRVWRIRAKGTSDQFSHFLANESPTKEEIQTSLQSRYLVERRLAARQWLKNKDAASIQELKQILGDYESLPREQLEALWSLANLPKGSLPESFFVPRAASNNPNTTTGGMIINGRHTEVIRATWDLMGTTHFPYPEDTYFSMTYNRLTQYNILPSLDPRGLDPTYWKIKAFSRAKAIARTAHLDRSSGWGWDAGPLIPLLSSNDPFVRARTLYALKDFRLDFEIDPEQDNALKNNLAQIYAHFLMSQLQFKDPSFQSLINQKPRRYNEDLALNDNLSYLLDGTYLGFLQSFVLLARQTGLARHSMEGDPMFQSQPELIQQILNTPVPAIKRLAVQWIAEEKLIDLKPQVEALFDDPDLTPDLFLATLAALEMLDGKPPQEFDKTPPGKYVLPILKDESKPANVRAIALQLVDPNDEELPAELVAGLMRSDNEQLKLEAVRTAALSTKDDLTKPLAEIALDIGQSDEVRAEAVVGLARHVAVDPDLKGVLELIGKSDKPMIAREAFRSTRQRTKERPQEAFEIEGEPAATAGRRLFFHPNGPGCYKCHTVHGRGGKIGPDLSTIGAAMSREKLIESIRKPSQEVAPQFTTWTMISTAGKAYTGMIVHENRGDTVLGLQDGTTIQLKTADVEERSPQKTSVMPEKLEQQMTDREFEDLLKYLESLKSQ